MMSRPIGVQTQIQESKEAKYKKELSFDIEEAYKNAMEKAELELVEIEPERQKVD